MTCKSFIQRLNSTLEESWEADALAMDDEMVAHAAQCRDCAARLDAAQRILGPDPGTITLPAGLEERVLHHVTGNRPDRRQWVPLLAAAALLVALTATVTVAVMDRQPPLVEVRLVLTAPGASQVSVVGDWNNWNPAAQPLLDRDGDGVWELRFRLDPNREYEYQFVVDEEQWISDPDALIQVTDGFGGTNSILDI